MSQRTLHAWKHIEDITHEEAQRIKNSALRSHMHAWSEQRRALEARASYGDFNQRLKREWAVETGLIERLYTLDRGVTRLLIERGIDAALIPHGASDMNSAKLVRILQDHEEAYESLRDWVATSQPLSEGFIRRLHALLTRNQEATEALDSLGRLTSVRLRRGEYKQRSNNPQRADGRMHEYCPPVHVDAEMNRLVALHEAHVDQGLPVEVSVAWLHHRFTQIHPFQDGNGRVARALATMVLLKAGWFPLVIRDEGRADYLTALESADSGNLGPFVELISEHQSRAFLQAFSISRDVISTAKLGDRISAIRQTFEAQRKRQHQAWLGSREVAAVLHTRAVSLATSLVTQLLEGVAGAAPEGFKAFADHGEDGDDQRSHWFRRQIISIAQGFGYFANLDDYRSWARIVLNGGSRTEILFSIHGVGSDFRGVMAVSAFLYTRSPAESAQDEGSPTRLSSLPFQFTYVEVQEEVEQRFTRWFETAVERGLAHWQALI